MLAHLIRLNNKTFILQYNKGNLDLINKIISRLPLTLPPNKFNNVNFLYDASGGAGKTIEYIHSVIDNHLTGYAGGLNPTNLEEAIEKIINANHPDAEIWIDTESGVRSPACNSSVANADVLDLDKVVQFLRIVEPYTK